MPDIDPQEKVPETSSLQVEEVVEEVVEGEAEIKDKRPSSNSNKKLKQAITNGRVSQSFLGSEVETLNPEPGVGKIQKRRLNNRYWWAKFRKNVLNKKIEIPPTKAIYWYAYDRQEGEFKQLNEKIKRGTTIVKAEPVAHNEKFIRITVKGEDDVRTGYVRKKHLSINEYSQNEVLPFHIDPYGLIAPYKKQQFKDPSTNGFPKGKGAYNESNFEWYLNLAILMDAYRSLEDSDNPVDKDTQRNIALAALQGFAKTAGILSPRTKGNPIPFKEKKPPVSDQEQPEHQQFMGLQTTAFFDNSSYWRNGGTELEKYVKRLVEEHFGLVNNKVLVVSDSLAIEAFQRHFPLRYDEDTKQRNNVDVTIDNADSFRIAITSLSENIISGSHPSADFVFNMSAYFDDMLARGKLSQTRVNEAQNELGNILVEVINKNKVYKNLLVEHIYKKIKLLVGQNYRGIDFVFELKLSAAATKIKNVKLTDQIETLEKTLNYSGVRVDPLSAKEALLELVPFEKVLEEEKIVPVTLDIGGDQEKSPQNIGQAVRRRLIEKDLLAPDNNTKDTLFTSFEEFCDDDIFKDFEALSNIQHAPPYLKIYPGATAALIKGLGEISLETEDEVLTLDRIFEEKGIQTLLQTLYTLMILTMETAIYTRDKIVLFLNQIEKLHNYIQIILAITRPYEQDVVFANAIKEALSKPPIPKVEKEDAATENTPVSLAPSEDQKSVEEIKPKKSKWKIDFLEPLKKIGRLRSNNKSKKAAKKEITEKIVPDEMELEIPTDPIPATIPRGLEDLTNVYHQASSMHATDSTLASVEYQKRRETESNGLTVLVLKDNYYESIGNSGYNGLVQRIGNYEVFVLDGANIGPAKEELTEADFEDNTMPQEKIDIFVCDFHHNISLNLDLYKAENLIKQVDLLFQQDLVADRFTVAIDSTIDYIRSKDVQLFLEAFEDRIRNGSLNVVLYRSAQKFNMLGLDNYYGGHTITINNGASYADFNERISLEEDHVKGLTHQGLAHLAKYANEHMDQYFDAIVKNTLWFYNKLDHFDLTQPSDKGSFHIARTEDPQAVFIDIRRGFSFVNRFKQWAKENGKMLTTRNSFGFATTNLAFIPGQNGNARDRVTFGLESQETMEDYANFFIATRTLDEEGKLSIGNTWREPEFDLIDHEMQRLKGATRISIFSLEKGKIFSLGSIPNFMLGELNVILNSPDYTVVLDPESEFDTVATAVRERNGVVLAQYTIEVRGITVYITKIEEDQELDLAIPPDSWQVIYDVVSDDNQKVLTEYTIRKMNEENELDESDIPDKPSKPDKLGKSSKLSKPDKPGKPSKSGKPSKPGEPKDLEVFENVEELLENFELIPPGGIENVGTTCYIASVLQILANTTEYRNSLKNIADVAEKKQFANSTLKLINKINKGEKVIRKEINSYRDQLIRKGWLKNSLDNEVVILERNQQQDANQLLSFILEFIEYNQEITINFEHRPLNKPKLEDKQHSTPILQIGELDPGGSITLDALIARNYDQEKYDEDGNMSRQTIIGQLPDTITITINRHIYTKVKLKEPIQREKPESGLEKLVTHGIQTRSSNQQITDYNEIELKNSEGSFKSYTLTGFIVHSGMNIGLGHYISYIKKGEKWYEVDDSTVRHIDSNEAMLYVQNAYSLTYQKAPKQPTHRKRLAKKRQNKEHFTFFNRKGTKKGGTTTNKPKKNQFRFSTNNTNGQLNQFQDMDKLNGNMKSNLLAELNKEAKESKVSFNKNLDLREMILLALNSNDETVLKNYKVTETQGGGFHIIER